MAGIFTGQVQNGVIILDEGTPPLPDGTKVRVEADTSSGLSPLLELIDRLDQMPGDPNWPADAASRHDDYLYGDRKPS